MYQMVHPRREDGQEQARDETVLVLERDGSRTTTVSATVMPLPVSG
jgi:hypothetical protein